MTSPIPAGPRPLLRDPQPPRAPRLREGSQAECAPCERGDTSNLVAHRINTVFGLRWCEPFKLQLTDQATTRKRRVLQIISSAQRGLLVPISIHRINTVFGLRWCEPFKLQLTDQATTRKRRVLQIISSAQRGLLVPISIHRINTVFGLRWCEPFKLQLTDQATTRKRRVLQIISSALPCIPLTNRLGHRRRGWCCCGGWLWFTVRFGSSGWCCRLWLRLLVLTKHSTQYAQHNKRPQHPQPNLLLLRHTCSLPSGESVDRVASRSIPPQEPNLIDTMVQDVRRI